MKLLVVEDEKSLALEMEAILMKAFYLCDLAFTAKRSTADDAKQQVDFILLDLGLPDQDGLQLLKSAKRVVQYYR